MTAAAPIRLAVLVTRMDTGGVPEHIMALLGGLAATGRYQIVLISREVSERYRSQLDAFGIRIETLAMERTPNLAADIRSARALFRLLKRLDCDILHSHMSKAALLGGIVGRLAGVPLIVNTAHNLGCIALPQRSLRALFWAYDKLLFALTTDVVITVSERIRERLLALRLLPKRKLFAIPNGIDPSRFESGRDDRSTVRRDLGFDDSAILLGCVARLVWFKGLDVLIRAMPGVLSRLPQCRLLLVGDGPLQERLEELAQRLELAPTVCFLAERSDIERLYGAFDIFVLPSVSEGMPITILEAMAASLPIVATDVGGVGEIIESGTSGLLVPPRCPDELARAIARLAADPGLRQRLGAAAYARLRARFLREHMVEATDRLYRALVRKP